MGRLWAFVEGSYHRLPFGHEETGTEAKVSIPGPHPTIRHLRQDPQPIDINNFNLNITVDDNICFLERTYIFLICALREERRKTTFSMDIIGSQQNYTTTCNTGG